MDPELPTGQPPTPPHARPGEPLPQPPNLRPWELPFAQPTTSQQGQPPWPPGGVAATAQKRSHIWLIIGIIVIVVVVGVIAAGIIAFRLLHDTVTAAKNATKSRTSSAAAPSAAPATVVVDGQALTIRSRPVCAESTITGDITISVDASQMIAVTLKDGNPPQAESVSLGNIDGRMFSYVPDLGQGSAEVARDGKAFKITGTATAVDYLNPGQPLYKSFEIDVTCPNL